MELQNTNKFMIYLKLMFFDKINGGIWEKIIGMKHRELLVMN